MPFAPNTADADLVSQSLAGNREAFQQIVERYQSLICSLAYSATGSLSQSEDFAQETFITAWKELPALREPARLRSWLCSIVRYRIGKSFRRQQHEPIHNAEPLEEISNAISAEPAPLEQTISHEEEAILWRSLECIPEIYREPLVLFYREHQSIQSVATDLELSEDAVKQRLSRGRKLLQEQVLSFVEGTLERTRPGKTFTMGVITALPLLATSTKVATVGVTATKGSAIFKTLFMTKTTQAIIVAAATATVILTTQTAWHHFQNPGGRGSVRILTLSVPQASEATQAARGFFDALANGDWKTVGQYWPPNAPKGKSVDDIFTPKLKDYVAGMQVINMGIPYKQGGMILVPYEVQWKDGNTQTNNLRLAKGRDGNWIWIGGF